MYPSLNTTLQSWARPTLLIFVFILTLLHVGSFFIGIFFAPTMFHASQIPGTVCVKDCLDPTWYKESASEAAGCVPVSNPSPESHLMGDTVLAFRFPSDKSIPTSLSRWNWRLLGSLKLEVSIDNLDDLGEDDDGHGVAGNKSSFSIRKKNVPVRMVAKLDSLGEIMSSYSQNQQSSVFEWHREAEIDAKRTLSCSVSTRKPGADDDKEATADYSCTLTPLISIEMLSNTSYIVQVTFSPAIEYEAINETYSEPYEVQETMTSVPVKVRTLALTLVVEDDKFHEAVFYLKCISVPFILGGLVLFCIRLYLNDLYVAIPDRLLVTSALAQILQNIPVEALIAEGNMWEASPYLKLFDDTTKFLLMSCLFLYWIVYTKDKISTKEPWERNTRYYWRQISLVTLGGMIAAMWAVYGRGPGIQNSFKNHWLVETPTVSVSLGLIFSLAALALAYQTYLSVLVFRALCDISVVQYGGRSYVPQRIWRIKMVLMYNFAVSVLTIGGLILQLAVELSLHWNPQFYLNPIPFHLTFASAYIIGLYALWNLHIISSLVMLSRSNSGSSDDYIHPVAYTCHDQSLHHVENNGHGAANGGEPYDSMSFGSETGSHLKRRQSSEDFLELQRHQQGGANGHDFSGRVKERGQVHEYHDEVEDYPEEFYDDHDEEQHLHQHHQCRGHVVPRVLHMEHYQREGPSSDDFSEAVDSCSPFSDEVDPIEAARQESVHAWEEDEEEYSHHYSSDIVDGKDAFMMAHAPPTAYVSDDIVLYER